MPRREKRLKKNELAFGKTQVMFRTSFVFVFSFKLSL